MWLGAIIATLVVGLWLYYWMTGKLNDNTDRLTFERKMEAVKAAEDEARRWR